MKTKSSFAKTVKPNTLAAHFITTCIARLLSLVLWTLPALVHAQFNYTTNNGTITITGYTGTNGTAIIPSTTNGLSVTCIGTNAFNGCTSLTNVTIPNSVTSIAYGAFWYCTHLLSVTVPDGVTNIGNYAFIYCTA